MADRPSSDHVAAWRALLTWQAVLTERKDAALRAADVMPLRWYDALFSLYEARRCWRIYGAEIEARVGRRLTVSEARTLRALLARLVEAA